MNDEPAHKHKRTARTLCDLAQCRIANSPNVIFQKMEIFSEHAVRTSSTRLVALKIHLPF